MKPIIIYRSKTGFAKRYAEWINKEIGGDIFKDTQVNIDMLSDYDTVIFGGGLYVIGINGVKLITDNLDKLKGKKVAVFATGATPFREKDIDEVKKKNFTEEQQKYIKFFYLRGGFDYNKLKPFDKLLMIMLKLKIKLKKEKSPDERGMLAAYSRPVDFSQKKNIVELLSYINSKDNT